MGEGQRFELDIERLAAAMFDAQEIHNPSYRVDTPDGEYRYEPDTWERLTTEGLYPGTQTDMREQARLVIEFLNAAPQPTSKDQEGRCDGTGTIRHEGKDGWPFPGDDPCPGCPACQPPIEGEDAEGREAVPTWTIYVCPVHGKSNRLTCPYFSCERRPCDEIKVVPASALDQALEALREVERLYEAQTANYTAENNRRAAVEAELAQLRVDVEFVQSHVQEAASQMTRKSKADEAVWNLLDSLDDKLSSILSRSSEGEK